MNLRTLSIFAIFACSIAKASDWPTFRGADRTDIQSEPNILNHWPKGGPKKVWTFDQAGLGYSGYSIVKGVLYTMGADEAGEFLVAVDVATGKEKWRAVVGGRLANGWGDGPRSTPTVDGDRVYSMGGKGDLVCFNVADGKPLWKVSMLNFGGKEPSWGYCESVLVEGDNVFCTPGGDQGTMLALNKITGEKVWQSSEWTDPAQYASIVPANINGVRQLIQLTMQSVAGVDAKTGKALWIQKFPGRVAVIPTPVVKDNFVYVSAGYKVGCMLLKVGADNFPEVIYENTNMVNHHGGVVLVGEHLYGFSDGKGWVCQDFKTGEIVWQDKTLGKGAIHAVGEMLYLLDESTGDVALIKATPKGYEEHGRMVIAPKSEQRNPKGKIWTHPVVSNGKLYLRDQEFVSSFLVKK